MLFAVQQCRKHALRDPGHVVRAALEFAQLQLPFPLEVRVVKPRLDDHLTDQLQSVGQSDSIPP